MPPIIGRHPNTTSANRERAREESGGVIQGGGKTGGGRMCAIKVPCSSFAPQNRREYVYESARTRFQGLSSCSVSSSSLGRVLLIGLMSLALFVRSSSAQARDTSEAFDTTTIAGDGKEGYRDGNSSVSKFAFINPIEYIPSWLIGVTVMADDRTALVIDNYNQAIRKIDLRAGLTYGVTTTLISTWNLCKKEWTVCKKDTESRGKIACFDKCSCPSDLTAECGKATRHVQAAQMSGIVGYDGIAYFINSWNRTNFDASEPKIWKINVNDPEPEASPIAHIDLGNYSFQPRGLAKGPTTDEIIFTNYGSSISKINVQTGVITYLAGPRNGGMGIDDGREQGYQDGFGTQVQTSTPMGITTDKRLKYSYFVDEGLCNVRRLDLATLEVTTAVGPRSKNSAGNNQCGYADGTGEEIRFTRPVGIAYLAGNRLVVTDARDHVVRIIDLNDLSSKTLGFQKVKGWFDLATDAQTASLLRFNFPSGIGVTSNGGTFVIADQGSNRVRVIKKVCPPFYIVVEGICAPCDPIGCGLGYFRSMCVYDQTDGICKTCPINLPQSAMWDDKMPNCTWTCQDKYVKVRVSGDGGLLADLCVAEKTTPFQISEPLLFGIIGGAVALFICIGVVLMWCCREKKKVLKEEVEFLKEPGLDKVTRPDNRIVLGRDYETLEIGREPHDRNTDCPLLLEPSCHRKGNALSMHQYIELEKSAPLADAGSGRKNGAERDPLAETMAELGFSSSSTNRFGSRLEMERDIAI